MSQPFLMAPDLLLSCAMAAVVFKTAGRRRYGQLPVIIRVCFSHALITGFRRVGFMRRDAALVIISSCTIIAL